MFNATHGARRLLYRGPGGWQVDIFLDTFEMSHTLDLGARLEAEPETLAAAELLLTKLQVAEVNAKDLSDAAMLLWDHEPGRRRRARPAEPDPDGGQAAAPTGACTRPSPTTSAPAHDLLGDLVPAGPDREPDRAAGSAPSPARWRSAPKTVRWQLRAKVGRRMRWYQLPEEVTR